MLSYKEYKLLNESLYGAFNLGLRSHGTVGGIVSGSNINGTEAAIEAEAEEAIEEAKKMKKKMEDEEEEELLDNPKSEKDSDEEEDSDDEEGDDDDDDSDDEEEGDDDEDSDDEDSDEDEEVEDKKKDFAFMKKKMKKKSKKEWSEVMSDLEDLLEVVEDEDALSEVKKGLEMMKKGMEKGMDGDKKCGKYMKKGMDGGCKKCGKYMSEGKKNHMKNHKPDCKCPMCSGDNKFGKKMGKKMNEGDQAWWDSVNSMLGANPDQKNWDGGWSEVGEVQQAIREEKEINEWWPFKGKDQEDPQQKVDRIARDVMSGDSKEYHGLEPQFQRAVQAAIENQNSASYDQSLQNQLASARGKDATRKAQAQEAERQDMMRASDLRDRRKYGAGGAGGAQRARDNAPQRYGREDTPAGEDHGY